MAIAYVKDTGKFSTAAAASINQAFGSAVSAGALLVTGVSGWRSPTAFDIGATGVSDDVNGNHSQAVKSAVGTGDGNRAAIHYFENSAAGTPTVTVAAAAGSDNSIEAVCVEYSGAATSSSLDQTQSNVTGSPTDASTGTTGTTSQADEVAVAVMSASAADPNLNITTPSTYTRRAVNQDANSTIGFEYADKILSATGTQSAAWTHDNANTAACIATFKAAATGPTVVASSEALRAGLGEDRALLGTMTRQDTVVNGLADASSVRALFSSGEALAVGLSELSSVAQIITGTEALALGLTESASLLAQLTREDVLVVGLSEDRTIAVTLTGAEALALGLLEQPLVLSTFSSADNVVVIIVEASDVAISEGDLVAKSSSDALAVGLVDAYASLLTTVGTLDTLPLNWQEGAAILASLSRSDSLTLGLTESGAVAVAITGTADALKIGLTESQSVFVAVAGAEAVQLLMQETTALLATLRREETIPINITDALNLILTTLTSQDAPAVIIVDGSLVTVPLASADAVMVGLTEDGTAVEVFLNRLGSVLVATVRPLVAARTVTLLSGERTVEVL